MRNIGSSVGISYVTTMLARRAQFHQDRLVEAVNAFDTRTMDAQQLIRTSDRRRSQVVQSLAGRPWTDACLYDLVVDTSTVGLDAAAAAVMAVVSAKLKARQ